MDIYELQKFCILVLCQTIILLKIVHHSLYVSENGMCMSANSGLIEVHSVFYKTNLSYLVSKISDLATIVYDGISS